MSAHFDVICDFFVDPLDIAATEEGFCGAARATQPDPVLSSPGVVGGLRPSGPARVHGQGPAPLELALASRTPPVDQWFSPRMHLTTSPILRSVRQVGSIQPKSSFIKRYLAAARHSLARSPACP